MFAAATTPATACSRSSAERTTPPDPSSFRPTSYWGFTISDSGTLNVVLGIGMAVASIVLWGIYAAPKSERRLQGSALLVFKIIFFALAVIARITAGSTTLGVTLALGVVNNLALAYLWQQETL